ncbi:LAG1 longevity assurance 1 [Fasciola gigantica]|uniref:LAG1 longevity assurance 1 n=1 Tax=Fasciola gigantica TaxID=46835 RepID=A0A504YUF3_FASGI|nr:LAG1 longevity assurance 1 [Fasciola gigantica]
MAKSHWFFRLLLIWFTTCYALSHDKTTDQREQIFDPETGQYFPISELSKLEDPQFVLPDPDPAEFPPEYLAELLTHCDDPVPGAWEFLQKTWIAFNEFAFNWSRYPVSHKVFLRILMAVQPRQLLHVFIVAVLLSVARYMLERCLSEFIRQRLGITTPNVRRLFESSWKAFWYLILWLCTFHAVMLKGRTDFQYPLRMFRDVKVSVGYFDVPTPPDYYRVYTLQLGFYLHSLWSVICIDSWRKDSAVLVVHHVMTLLMLEFSLVLRLHRVGALVVLLHDLNDVFLELAKVNVYLRSRHGKICQLNVTLSNLLFALFATSWIIMRLYWFPLKVLYATSWGVYITQVGRECRSFLFFNTMLWGLFLMHIYWFRFIFIMAVRLVRSPQCGDIREEELADNTNPITKNGVKSMNGNGIYSNSSSPIRLQANGIKRTAIPTTFPVTNGDVNHLKCS